MDDINFEVNNVVFNYRVAILIRNDNKILVQEDNRFKHLTLPGGRCKLGETSIEASIREFKEETNIDIEFVRNIGMIENFFNLTFDGKRYHEILIVHEMKFNNKGFYNEDIIYNIEDNKKEHLKYKWIDVQKLKSIDFRPRILLENLDKDSFQHIINKD